MPRASISLRLFLALSTLAVVLVPALWSPARAITVPVTLARTVTATGPASASFAFEASHIAFSWTGDEGTGVRYRTIADGEASRWRRVAESDDVEVPGRHMSGVIAVDRPNEVEWEPIVPERNAIGPVKLDFLNTLDGPRRRVEIPATANAEATDPDVVTRAEWGADESIRRRTGECRPSFYPVQQLFVHHTVGANNDPHPKATMRAIYQYHTVSQGWCDIGYNFVISPDGRIFEGRYSRSFDPWEVHDAENRGGEAVEGAHVSGYNSGSVGVSLMGNYSTTTMTRSMRSTLVNFLAWEADRHNLAPRARHTYRNPVTGLVDRRLHVIAGHREAGQTECPGNSVFRGLDGLRSAVKIKIGDGKLTTRVSLGSLTPVSPAPGTPIELAGRLTTGGGDALPRREILVRVKPRNRPWRKELTTITEEQGRFVFELAPRRDMAVVAQFKGDAGLWGSQSRRLKQQVAN